MATSSALRRIAYAYSHSVTRFFVLGLDDYQILLAFVLLASLCAIAFLASTPSRALVNRFCPPWLYCAFLMCTLLVARLPTFLPLGMNPDESMLLAGAMKLRHYPVFWQSVDGQTSGPLNYYALTFLNLLGLPLDYATARLLNVICIGGAIAIVYLIARLLMADWTARLTPLPALAAAMAFRDFNVLHYSSECVSVLLIALGAWLLFVENLSNRPNWARGVGIGIIAVLIPLAKLQAAPMAATIALGGVLSALFWGQDSKWRRILYISLGLVAGVGTLLVLLSVFGVFGAFQQSYITNNIQHANLYPPIPLERFVTLFSFSDFKWHEGGILACALYVIASACYLWMRRRGNQTRARPCFSDLFVFAMLAATLYAIYRPRTGFLHYFTFLIVPLALVGVQTLTWSLRVAGSNPTALRPAILFVLFTLALPFLIRGWDLRLTGNSEAWMASPHLNLKCSACQLVNEFAKPGDPVTVWGWEPALYVLTGTLPATRDTHMPSEFMIRPQQDYYRRRYMNDLQTHPPKVFIDAVGPRQFGYTNRETAGFETFPELREYVTNNFYLAGDIDGVRVFARKGAAAPFDRSSNLK